VDEELDRLLEMEQYSLPAVAKEPTLIRGMNRLTDSHRDRCVEYARVLRAADPGLRDATQLGDVPYLPISLFKWLELRSVPSDEIFKVLTSSGTTTQMTSRIYLDVETARLQTRALSSIITHYLGLTRRPMLIIDHPNVIKDRRQLSARGAGILGMLSYGRDHHYVLDDDMRLDRPALDAWLERHAGEELLLFGFTFMVWEHFYNVLRVAGIDLSKATLVHSGGWKRLADIAVSNEIFKSRLQTAFGLERVHNFYGMAEQVGSVFFDCPAGFFHAPNFADVLVRDPTTWEPAALGDEGVVEVLSLLPRSYPGHALLTEDLGTVHGVDDCPCGRMGSRFTVSGRVPKVQIRGCSDTYEHVA